MSLFNKLASRGPRAAQPLNEIIVVGRRSELDILARLSFVNPNDFSLVIVEGGNKECFP
jgi:hypothetical protein